MAFPGIFHRLTVPTYVGGLPATHDFINDPVGNGFGGKVPANADGYLSDVANPNEGTYFCGFEEDATSLVFNRSNLALAANTDILDDLFHRELAMPSADSHVTGGATTDITITGEVYVGTGFPDTQLIRSSLIQLIDNATSIPLTVDVAGVETPVLVTAIEAVLAGGTVVGSGWQVDPVISVLPAIPDSVDVGILFSARGNPAVQPEFMLIGAFRGAGNWEAPTVAKLINMELNDFTFDGEKTFLDAVFFGAAAPATFDANATFNASAVFNDIARIFDGLRFGLPTAFADKEALNFGFDGSYNGEVRGHIMQLDTPGAVGTHLYWSVSGGLEVTINAIWAEGTALWQALDLASNSYRYKLGLAGLVVEKLDVPANAAPWADAAWSPNASTSVLQGQASFHQLLSQVPLLTSPDKAADDPVDANAIWKLLWEFETGAAEAQKVRAYAGLGTDSGRFCITYNSRYDPSIPPLSLHPAGSWISDSAAANGTRRLLIGEGDPEFAFQTNSGDVTFPAADDEWGSDFAVDSGANVEISKIRRYQYNDGGRVHTGHVLNIYDAVEDTTLAASGDTTMAHEVSGLGITCSNGGGGSDFGRLTIPIRLPQGATLTRVRAQLEATIGQGNIQVEFNEHTRADGTAGSITANQQVAGNFVGTFDTVELSGAPFPVTIDNVGKQYFLSIQFNTSLGPVTLHDIRLDWTDPGPRND